MNRYKKTGLGLLIVILPILTILSTAIDGLGINHAHAQATDPFCQKYTDPADKTACQTGSDGKQAGTPKVDSCQIITVARQKAACQDGWDNSTAANDNACEAKNNTGLEWLICGVLRAIDDTVQKINNEINKQLDYNVPQNLGDDHSPVHQAWSIFRTLASVVLVIILLVMILAQATGGGPFEAYTIRKLLPKIVIAIILIQVSWWMFIYLVEIVNDVGNGVGDLLAAPFGGQDKLSFDNLIGSLGSAAPGLTLGASTFLAAIALIINPFGALLLAMFVVIGVLVALGVLLFRQALITACIIFAPIALVLWILPGTNRYWKLWWENFTKALFLFPIIASMLVIGHIFAWIIASSGGTVGPLDVFAVVLGFFGPFYLLPKAFSWGGSAMSIAARGINSGTTKLSEKPKALINNRKEGLAAEKARRSAERVARGAPSILRGDQFRSGQWDPTLGRPGSRRRRRQIDAYVGKGVASADEDVKAANARLQLQFEQLDERIRGNDKDDLVRAMALGNTGHQFTDLDGNTHTVGRISDVDQRAALDQLAKLGGAGNIRAIDQAYTLAQQAGGTQLENMNKFLNANAGSLFAKMPHLYKGVHGTVDGLSPEALTGIDGVGMEHLVGDLSTRAAAGDTTATEDLASLVSTFNQASSDETLRGRINPSAARAMKALVDGTNMADINANQNQVYPAGHPQAGQRIPGTVPISGQVYDPIHNTPTPLGQQVVAVNPELGVIFERLHAQIDENGSVRPAQSQPQQQQPAGPPTLGQHLGNAAEVPDFEVHNTVQQIGGWHNLSDNDVIEIYNQRSGDVKSTAEGELRRRGRIP